MMYVVFLAVACAGSVYACDENARQGLTAHSGVCKGCVKPKSGRVKKDSDIEELAALFNVSNTLQPHAALVYYSGHGEQRVSKVFRNSRRHARAFNVSQTKARNMQKNLQQQLGITVPQKITNVAPVGDHIVIPTPMRPAPQNVAMLLDELQNQLQ